MMLNSGKKLHFYEDQDVMAIEFSWYAPTAWFFLFFTIFWNVFLVFWYTMAFAGGAPLVFKLFPLIHVAVGIFLIYNTLCQFLNKTHIEIDSELLTIQHNPIPWWRGNVEIVTDDINQLYVKESKSQTKNGTSYSYSLRAKLNDNSDKEILSVTGVETQQMLEIEEQLERFIGIVDRPVKGEYKSRSTNASAIEQPRRQHRNFTDSALASFYFSEKGEFFDFKEKEAKVISLSQYDWNDGNSDKLMQLSNDDGKEKLVYFEQNLAILNAFEEQSINLVDVGSLDFNVKDAPKSIEIVKEQYQLSEFKKGKKFVSGGAQALEVEQWCYISKDGQLNIRVINNGGVIHYYLGKRLGVGDFGDRLDLDELSERDVEFREREWGDEDLV